MRDMIRNVLFDLGNVVIDVDIRKSIGAFKSMLAVSSASALPVTAMDLLGGGESVLIQKYQTGEISTEQFVNTILLVCQPGTTAEQIEKAWMAMLIGIPEQRMERLRALKNAGFGVYVLSNINELHVQWTLDCFRKAGISVAGRDDMACAANQSVQLDGVFFSNEMRLAKPDIACYEKLLQETGIRPEETLYIDDLEQNIEVGKKVGFECLQAMGDAWLPMVDQLIANV